MSTDYYFACEDCKKLTRCIASASISYGEKLWTKELDKLRDFLFEHEGHAMRFVNEHHPLADELFECV